jgi:hypothetical protein
MTAVAVHIIAGGLGIVFGFVALYAAKGARLHRKSGTLFVYAMLTMSVLGAAMAAVWGRAPASNVPVGLLTAYLVMTALTTVRPPSAGSRWHALDQLDSLPAKPYFISPAWLRIDPTWAPLRGDPRASATSGCFRP